MRHLKLVARLFVVGILSIIAREFLRDLDPRWYFTAAGALLFIAAASLSLTRKRSRARDRLPVRDRSLKKSP